MSIKVVLFDLDGTLLPMDQDEFTKAYFARIAERLAPRGYEPKQFVASILAGTKEMVKNESSETNETVFWKSFIGIYGAKAALDKPFFDEFYHDGFDEVKGSCGFDPSAALAVRELKRRGYRVALATNPIFPSVATEKRIRWAGLSPDDFELFTTYENSCRCKPNTDYYRHVADSLGVRPEECIMVGNDVSEDMVAENIGMKVFLITEYLLNREGKDISVYPRGNFEALLSYLK